MKKGECILLIIFLKKMVCGRLHTEDGFVFLAGTPDSPERGLVGPQSPV